jgi:hypothetical protein
MCARVRARVGVRVRARVGVRVGVRARVRVRVRVFFSKCLLEKSEQRSLHCGKDNKTQRSAAFLQ